MEAMNVAVAGWAGAGKTTVAGTLARVAAAGGDEVLVIEDDPTPSLAVTLGLGATAEVAALPEDLLVRIRSDDGESEFELAKPPQVVVEDYGTPAPADVTLLKLAEIEHETTDLVNSPRITARKLVGALVRAHDAVTVIDAVDVVEHLPRAAVEAVDVLVVVVEPYYKSIEAGQRTSELAADLGFSDVRIVANKVRNGEQRGAILEFFGSSDLEVEAIVPYAEDIPRARRADRAPIDDVPESPGVQAICDLTEELLETHGK